MVICISNRDISFDDIINVCLKTKNNNQYKTNYYSIWKRKIEFFEKYYYDYYKKEEYDFEYYNGLSYNALNIVKMINYLNITYGISYNRFYNIKTMYDLDNPLYKKYGPIINSIGEYIKYEYFFKNREVNYEKIFDIPLTIDDYYYLVARLLFPTYFYDLFKNNEKYDLISNYIYGYISYVKRIIIEIKKRHNNMSLLESIINQL